jgi:hypothetical protein
MNVFTAFYYVSLPSTTIISHIANICMLESIGFVKKVLSDPKTKQINKKMQIFFRFTITLLILTPLLFGKSY